MKKYILIWEIDEYPDNGGGINYDFFESVEQVQNKMNELTKDSRVEINFCGILQNEIKFKPVEKIIKWEIEKE